MLCELRMNYVKKGLVLFRTVIDSTRKWMDCAKAQSVALRVQIFYVKKGLVLFRTVVLS